MFFNFTPYTETIVTSMTLYSLYSKYNTSLMLDVLMMGKLSTFIKDLYLVLRNKWTPLQIVITNGYTCSIFQVAKITRKTEITTNNTESLTHLLFIILKLNIINRKFCKYCIYFISSIV